MNNTLQEQYQKHAELLAQLQPGKELDVTYPYRMGGVPTIQKERVVVVEFNPNFVFPMMLTDTMQPVVLPLQERVLVCNEKGEYKLLSQYQSWEPAKAKTLGDTIRDRPHGVSN